MKSAKEILDELKAATELSQMGWTRPRCERCNGTGQIEVHPHGIPKPYLTICYSCEGTGHHEWVGPITK